MPGQLATMAIYHAWRALNRGAERRFRKALADVETVQTTQLMRLLQRNAGTGFGRRHGFGRMQSVADFQAGVPLTEYPRMEGAIRAIARGEQNRLTREPVLCLEPTSGSSHATKFVPCTASYLREFRDGIAVWMNNLFSIHPQITKGATFWSLTPNSKSPPVETQLPVGFPDDMVYAAGRFAPLLRKLSAVPAEVAKVADPESFYYLSLLFLLQSRNLTWVSIWNPGMWLLFWDRLQTYWPQLVKDLGAGTLSPPQAIERRVHRKLANHLRADKGRAEELSRVFRKGSSPMLCREIWPALTLISCWGDAWARGEFERLRESFPGVVIQKKGLLATEALVTIPMGSDNQQLLGVTSHFYEFISLKDGAVLLAHQLQKGRRYEVVVTTGGGLYRYRLRDVVEVLGHEKSCPMLSFVGRNDKVADFFGEKLHAAHAENELDRILEPCREAVEFKLLACETLMCPPGYVLYLEAATLNDGALLSIGQRLEAALRENYHYYHCREMGQLDRLKVFRVARDGRAAYLEACRAKGQRIGDVKSELLQLSPNWSTAFAGRNVAGLQAMEG